MHRSQFTQCASSSSRPSYHAELLDSLDDISLDMSLDQRSASSSTTLLSRRASSSLFTSQLLSDVNCASSEFELCTRLSESRQSCFRYPLHEPGQMTAQRTKRLCARTAVIINSIPATCEDVIHVDDPKPANVPAQHSKLRRVPGVSDLRSAFRCGDHALVHRASTSLLGVSKASYELGILVTPTPALSPRSSLRTLVDVGNTLPQGEVKTLCESTLGSLSISSRLSTKLHFTFSPSRTPPNDTSQPIFLGKYRVRNLSITQPRHTSLQLDTCLSQSPGETVWSCAKISRSAIKRAARRGHTPRRVFSHPIAALPP